MSLRDALLKSGAVDKKKVQQAERELKEQRRQAQANRDAKALLEAREAEAARLAAEERERKRVAERKAREDRARREMHALRVRQILEQGAMRPRNGPFRFWFHMGDGKTLLKWELSLPMVRGLREGRFAIGDLRLPWAEPRPVLVTREVALKVKESDPGALLFFNEERAPTDRENLSVDEDLGKA